ncbi:MAG: hypothetical protein ACRYHQ_06565 [Janthinobacterium lividum]
MTAGERADVSIRAGEKTHGVGYAGRPVIGKWTWDHVVFLPGPDETPAMRVCSLIWNALLTDGGERGVAEAMAV